MSVRLLRQRRRRCRERELCFLCSGPLEHSACKVEYHRGVGRVLVCRTCARLVQRIKDEKIRVGTYDHDGSITIVNASTDKVLIRGPKVGAP